MTRQTEVARHMSALDLPHLHHGTGDDRVELAEVKTWASEPGRCARSTAASARSRLSSVPAAGHIP